MKQTRNLALCSLGLLVAVGFNAPAMGAASELKLGTATGSNGDTVGVKLFIELCPPDIVREHMQELLSFAADIVPTDSRQRRRLLQAWSRRI